MMGRVVDMSKLDKVKAELYNHGIDAIDELGVEYPGGKSSSFNYEELLEAGSNEDKESALLSWLDNVDWDEAEELEVELHDGTKFEIDLDAD